MDLKLELGLFAMAVLEHSVSLYMYDHHHNTYYIYIIRNKTVTRTHAKGGSQNDKKSTRKWRSEATVILDVNQTHIYMINKDINTVTLEQNIDLQILLPMYVGNI